MSLINSNITRCLRTPYIKCPCCEIKGQKFLHMIRSYKQNDGIKYFTKVACGECSTILYNGETWEKAQTETEKFEMNYVFLTHSTKSKIFQNSSVDNKM